MILVGGSCGSGGDGGGKQGHWLCRYKSASVTRSFVGGRRRDRDVDLELVANRGGRGLCIKSKSLNGGSWPE